jgi:hypothetical protein
VLFRKPGCIGEDNIKTDLGGINCEDMNWVELVRFLYEPCVLNKEFLTN